MKKRILAALLALGCALLVFTGCGSKKDTTPKDYTQIILSTPVNHGDLEAMML